MKFLEVKKEGKNKVLFLGKKRIGILKHKFVKVGDKFEKKNVKLEMYCSTFYVGWEELALDEENNFEIDKDWTKKRILLRCPCCRTFINK